MKADLKAKWIAALRSGEYQQGHGVLRSGDHYCCLGVLCEVALKAGVLLNVNREATSGNNIPVVKYDEAIDFLPRQVKEWAGLDREAPEVAINGVQHTLAELNDGDHSVMDGEDTVKFGFIEIADLIEANL